MKNAFNYIMVCILFLFFSECIVGQNVRMYVHIKDPSLIPEKVVGNDQDRPGFKSNNAKMNGLLTNHNPKVFKQAFPTAKTDWLREVYLIESDNKELGKSLKREFKEKIPLVEYLDEPQLVVDDYTPNDYHTYQTHLDLIRVKEAYNYYKDLPKIPLALTDTYFEDHEDLMPFIDIWGSNSIVDYHGTYVLGLMSAVTDNNLGIASIGYRSPSLASSNVFSDNEVLLIAQAGYRVINCSWLNTCTFNPVQDALYTEIRNDWDALVVFGAGNKHCGGGSAYCYPASYDATISVTAITHGTNPDWHEQTPGDVTTAYQHNDKVDICAPGYNVYTTDLMGSAGKSSGNYSSGWGTSFAAPQVTATLGVIFTINPCLSADEAEGILLNATDPGLYSLPENAPYIGLLGTGRLDVAAAVEAAVQSASVDIFEKTYTSDAYIEANYGISIERASVQNNAEVEFKARQEVVIEKNFSVDLGSELVIETDRNYTLTCN